MGAIQSIFAKSTISISDLRKNISSIIQDAGDSPLAVLNHNKPAAYILSAKAYEALMERLDDARLVEIAKKRLDGKRVKVKLSDL
jgi:antitoxin StbD